MIEDALNIIDRELAAIKDKAQRMVQEVTDILKKLKPKAAEAAKGTKPKQIWLRLKERTGYHTFSIVWAQVRYVNRGTGQIYSEDLTRGPRYRLPQGKFFSSVRGYPVNIQERLWWFESQFGEIRKQVSQLGRAREFLTQYLKAGEPSKNYGEGPDLYQ